MEFKTKLILLMLLSSIVGVVSRFHKILRFLKGFILGFLKNFLPSWGKLKNDLANKKEQMNKTRKKQDKPAKKSKNNKNNKHPDAGKQTGTDGKNKPDKDHKSDKNKPDKDHKSDKNKSDKNAIDKDNKDSSKPNKEERKPAKADYKNKHKDVMARNRPVVDRIDKYHVKGKEFRGGGTMKNKWRKFKKRAKAGFKLIGALASTILDVIPMALNIIDTVKDILPRPISAVENIEEEMSPEHDCYNKFNNISHNTNNYKLTFIEATMNTIRDSDTFLSKKYRDYINTVLIRGNTKFSKIISDRLDALYLLMLNTDIATRCSSNRFHTINALPNISYVTSKLEVVEFGNKFIRDWSVDFYDNVFYQEFMGSGNPITFDAMSNYYMLSIVRYIMQIDAFPPPIVSQIEDITPDPNNSVALSAQYYPIYIRAYYFYKKFQYNESYDYCRYWYTYPLGEYMHYATRRPHYSTCHMQTILANQHNIGLHSIQAIWNKSNISPLKMAIKAIEVYKQIPVLLYMARNIEYVNNEINTDLKEEDRALKPLFLGPHAPPVFGNSAFSLTYDIIDNMDTELNAVANAHKIESYAYEFVAHQALVKKQAVINSQPNNSQLLYYGKFGRYASDKVYHTLSTAHVYITYDAKKLLEVYQYYWVYFKDWHGRWFYDHIDHTFALQFVQLDGVKFPLSDKVTKTLAYGLQKKPRYMAMINKAIESKCLFNDTEWPPHIINKYYHNLYPIFDKKHIDTYSEYIVNITTLNDTLINQRIENCSKVISKYIIGEPLPRDPILMPRSDPAIDEIEKGIFTDKDDPDQFLMEGDLNIISYKDVIVVDCMSGFDIIRRDLVAVYSCRPGYRLVTDGNGRAFIYAYLPDKNATIIKFNCQKYRLLTHGQHLDIPKGLTYYPHIPYQDHPFIGTERIHVEGSLMYCFYPDNRTILFTSTNVPPPICYNVAYVEPRDGLEINILPLHNNIWIKTYNTYDGESQHRLRPTTRYYFSYKKNVERLVV